MKQTLLISLFLIMFSTICFAAADREVETKSAQPISAYGKTSGGVVTAIQTNSDGSIVINTPSGSTMEIDGSLSIGESLTVGGTGDGNYLEVEPDGTLVFNGDATVWDDLRVAASSAKLLGNSDPDWETMTGSVSQLAFASNVDQEVFFSVQLPHSWKLGSNIEPHVHWSPSTTDAGNVTWALEYAVSDIGGDLTPSTTLTITDAASGTALEHQLADMDFIDMSAYTSSGDVSTMLVCRLYRDVDNGDDYGADAFFHEFDIHYEIDTVGSRAELSK